MFGSENIHTVTMTIAVDPAGNDKYFPLIKMPKAAQVLSASMVSLLTQNDGTATLLRVERWGTAAAAVAGTVTTYLGGTATAAVLTALTPASAVIDSAQDNISEGEWLLLHYAEQGTGWISGDRLTFQVDYVFGQGA